MPEFEYDHLCHMGNSADDTLAELARIAGSGATLSPTTLRREPLRADAVAHRSQMAADQAVAQQTPKRAAPQPSPVTPVVVASAPPVRGGPMPHHQPSHLQGAKPLAESDLPDWAKATRDSAPNFDFDLQTRLEEAFGAPVTLEDGPVEQPAPKQAHSAAPQPASRPAPAPVVEPVWERRPVSGSDPALADDLDSALSAELDRALADEIAGSEEIVASPELKAQRDFEAELARMFLPEEGEEAGAAKPVPVDHIAQPAFAVPQNEPLPKSHMQAEQATETGAETLRASLHSMPERQEAVIVDPIFSDDTVLPPPSSASYRAASGGRGKRIAAGIAGIALAGGVAAVALGLIGGDNGPPPVIMAENTPVREKPADPGGQTVPNQDQAVYLSVEGRSNSDIAQPKLIDSEEKPIDVTTVAVDNAVLSGPLAPRTVRTLTVRPDGTIVGSTEQSPTRSFSTTTPAVSQRPATNDNASGVDVARMDIQESSALPVRQVSAPTMRVQPVAPKPVEVTAVEPKSEPAVTPKPVVRAKPAPKKPASVSSPYKVQISSQRSQAAAEKSYNSMARRYAGVIGGRGVDYQRTNIAGKGTYYRVRIPASSRSEANTICANLKRAGGSCFVTR